MGGRCAGRGVPVHLRAASGARRVIARHRQNFTALLEGCAALALQSPGARHIFNIAGAIKGILLVSSRAYPVYVDVGSVRACEVMAWSPTMR